MSWPSPIDPTIANRTLPAPTTLPAPSRYPVRSSEWWLDRMSRALSARQKRYELLDAYYRGTQDTQRLASKAFRESGLLALFPHLNANHSKLIVNAAAQRLVVLGFRLGGELRVDQEAARLWRRNELEAVSDIAHTESLVYGECPVLVEPNPTDETVPLITPQDPSQVIVWHAPHDRRIREAALKTWWDDEARRRLYILYLPDRIERWHDRQPSQMDSWMFGLFGGQPPQWELRETREQPASVDNPLGEVPMVVVPNEPRLSGSPEGEHEPALTLIDVYNKQLMDMITTSHEMAYPQWWAAGIEPGGAQSGVVAEKGQDRLLWTPNPEAKFGQFTAAMLDNYVNSLKETRSGIATITFTPYHYLLNMPSSVPPSGESITASEAALVDKISGHQRDKGSAWRTIMRLAFALAGDERRAQAMADGATVWEDPERRTESQHIDALGKMVTMLGVPKEAAWEQIPVSPETIERWRQMGDQSSEAERDQVEMATALIRAGYAPDASLKAVGLDPIRHLGLLPITLQQSRAEALVAAAAIAGDELPAPTELTNQPQGGNNQ